MNSADTTCEAIETDQADAGLENILKDFPVRKRTSEATHVTVHANDGSSLQHAADMCMKASSGMFVGQPNFETQRQRVSDEDVYNFFHSHRGYAVIIVNEKFKLQGNRDGADVDLMKMRFIAKRLGFRIYNEENELNLSKLKTLQLLNRVRQIDHSTSDCFVMLISTHGLEQRNARAKGRWDHVLVCADEQFIFTRDIIDMFNDRNCPSLTGKPKLFFIQSCRGSQADAGADLPVAHGSGVPHRNSPHTPNTGMRVREENGCQSNFDGKSSTSDNRTPTATDGGENVHPYHCDKVSETECNQCQGNSYNQDNEFDTLNNVVNETTCIFETDTHTMKQYIDTVNKASCSRSYTETVNDAGDRQSNTDNVNDAGDSQSNTHTLNDAGDNQLNTHTVNDADNSQPNTNTVNKDGFSQSITHTLNDAGDSQLNTHTVNNEDNSQSNTDTVNGACYNKPKRHALNDAGDNTPKSYDANDANDNKLKNYAVNDTGDSQSNKDNVNDDGDNQSNSHTVNDAGDNKPKSYAVNDTGDSQSINDTVNDAAYSQSNTYTVNDAGDSQSNFHIVNNADKKQSNTNTVNKSCNSQSNMDTLNEAGDSQSNTNTLNEALPRQSSTAFQNEVNSCQSDSDLSSDGNQCQVPAYTRYGILSDTSNTVTNPDAICYASSRAINEMYAPHTPVLHCESDMLVMYAIPEGMTAWRSPVDGSWMINDLYKVISSYDLKRPRSFLTLLTKTAAKMSSRDSKSSKKEFDGKKAIPVVEHKLVKDIWFAQK